MKAVFKCIHCPTTVGFHDALIGVHWKATKRFIVRPQQITKPPTAQRATFNRAFGKIRRYRSKIDSLTAVMAALYSSSVAITHSHQTLTSVRPCIISSLTLANVSGFLRRTACRPPPFRTHISPPVISKATSIYCTGQQPLFGPRALTAGAGILEVLTSASIII